MFFIFCSYWTKIFDVTEKIWHIYKPKKISIYIIMTAMEKKDEKMFEAFNPIYNNVSQVMYCASGMLGEEVVKAEIAVVVGHNGRNFVSSTDWRLTTVSGRKRILPFSIQPQYPNFIEAVAGVEYAVDERGRFSVTPDANGQEKSSVVIMPDESRFEFAPGQALKITVQPGQKFLATDCIVRYSETAAVRTYRIISDGQSKYGICDKDGRASRE